MNNNEKQSIKDRIEELSYSASLVSHSLTSISNSVYYSHECNEDNAESLQLVKLTVDSIKTKLEEIWKELPSNNE